VVSIDRDGRSSELRSEDFDEPRHNMTEAVLI
jgi:hypothetical protein